MISLVTFTVEILNGKLHFFGSDRDKFSKDTYLLFKKNHNFVPAPTNYRIKHFNQGVENFYLGNKVMDHFRRNVPN